MSLDGHGGITCCHYLLEAGLLWSAPACRRFGVGRRAVSPLNPAHPKPPHSNSDPGRLAFALRWGAVFGVRQLADALGWVAMGRSDPYPTHPEAVASHRTPKFRFGWD